MYGTNHLYDAQPKPMASNQKMSTICKLLVKTFDVIHVKGAQDRYDVEITFRNKPTQPVRVRFLFFETWNVIKARVQKLQDSDGICIVCFEKEEGEGNSNACDTCGEFLCTSCIEANFNTRGDEKCPVCRTAIVKYFLKIQELK
jgi:hypothetical protein